jgi:hypothetical protein
MTTEIWASIGVSAATVLLFIVPPLVYAWYALEQMIGDTRSYERVIETTSRS